MKLLRIPINFYNAIFLSYDFFTISSTSFPSIFFPFLFLFISKKNKRKNFFLFTWKKNDKFALIADRFSSIILKKMESTWKEAAEMKNMKKKSLPLQISRYLFGIEKFSVILAPGSTFLRNFFFYISTSSYCCCCYVCFHSFRIFVCKSRISAWKLNECGICFEKLIMHVRCWWSLGFCGWKFMEKKYFF